MSNNFLKYLQREHARLGDEIARASRRPVPEQMQLARLKKLKLAVRDQIAQAERDSRVSAAA